MSEERYASFNAMLDEVREETQRDGAIDLDTVLAEMDAVIDEAVAASPRV